MDRSRVRRNGNYHELLGHIAFSRTLGTSAAYSLNLHSRFHLLPHFSACLTIFYAGSQAPDMPHFLRYPLPAQHLG